MKKISKLKYRVVEIDEAIVRHFDLECWLAELLVEHWLERNSDRLPALVSECRDSTSETQKKEREKYGQSKL